MSQRFQARLQRFLFKNAAVDGGWVTLFFTTVHGEGELAENKIEGEKSPSNIFTIGMKLKNNSIVPSYIQCE